MNTFLFSNNEYQYLSFFKIKHHVRLCLFGVLSLCNECLVLFRPSPPLLPRLCDDDDDEAGAVVATGSSVDFSVVFWLEEELLSGVSGTAGVLVFKDDEGRSVFSDLLLPLVLEPPV